MTKTNDVTRCQAALDAQNAINLIWDGRPHTAHLWKQATDLIDRLYELGKEKEAEKVCSDRIAMLEREYDETAEQEFWDSLAHDELMGGVSPRVLVDCPF